MSHGRYAAESAAKNHDARFEGVHYRTKVTGAFFGTSSDLALMLTPWREPDGVISSESPNHLNADTLGMRCTRPREAR